MTWVVTTILFIQAFATAQAQVQTLTCPAPGGFGVVVEPLAAPVLSSLKTVANPVLPNGPSGNPRDDLMPYILNVPAAIQLGKALFWDMQAGSDNKTACATCHFQGGADVRAQNQLHPGADGVFGSGYGTNYLLKPADFPYFSITPPTRNIDNVTGSQGIRKSIFGGIDSKTGAEIITAGTDTTFGTFRQVTNKNAPSVINSVFNHRNFFNGRAQPEFNGVNIWGNRDGTARVWMLGANGSPVQTDIHIQNASLASQAVGPPLNPVEMSAGGRTFPDIGRKLLAAKPLGLQQVSPNDSVLGALADTTTGKGLKTTYTALIQQAFQPKWWNYSKKMPISYSMMEANFSLYWGLSIMLYEATLVSDNSPMDQYLLSRVFMTDPVTGAFILDRTTGLPILVRDNPALLDALVARLKPDTDAAGMALTSQDVLTGLALFERPVPLLPNPQPIPGSGHPAGIGSFPIPDQLPGTLPKSGLGCIGCHAGAELTAASVRNVAGPGAEAGDGAFKNAGFDLRLERMFPRSDWSDTGPLTAVPMSIVTTTGALAGPTQITFDPSTYAVNVTGMPGAGYTQPYPQLPLLLPTATYDVGWYDVGLRPMSEDAGVGGLDQFGKPLSWTRFFQTSGVAAKVPGNGILCAGTNLGTPFPNQVLNAQGYPLLSGALIPNEPTDVAGSFKVPGLRNVEFTGPYFHTGGASTLMQVVDFYDDGGNFGRATNPSKAPAIVPLMLSNNQRKSLLGFLLSLTDERVRLQQAPFDHPEIRVPNGVLNGAENTSTIPASGAGGSTALTRFLGSNPFLP